jgi:energy-converting hydrogenase A subunit A
MFIQGNEIYLLVGYLISIIISVIVAKGVGLPWLPDKPIRYSFNVSALFPTPVIAIGFLAIFYRLGYVWLYNGIVLAVIIGIISALFVKYLFYDIFPKPPQETKDE